jgi:hypothetical protein
MEFSARRYMAAAEDFLREIESGGFKLGLVGYDGRPRQSDRGEIIESASQKHVDLFLSRASPLE